MEVRAVFTVVVVLVVGSALVSEVSAALTMAQIKQMAKVVRNTCIGKTGADLALVDGIQRGEFTDDRNSKCYIKCCMSAMQVLKNGRYNHEMAVMQAEKMLPVEIKEDVKRIVTICKDAGVSTDDCELAYEITKCGFENGKDIFFFP